MNGERWSLPSDYGGRVDSVEPGDWVFYTEYKPFRRVWGQIRRAEPTVPDLHPCAMDLAILWEGESKLKHYRYGREQYSLVWVGKHRPICEHCGKPWPCESVTMQRDMERALLDEASKCVACGKSEGSKMTVTRQTPDGPVKVWYHTAKSRKACRAALVRAASDDELRILRSYDHA